MRIKIVSLLHAGVRVGPSEAEVAKARTFYEGLLGLETDGKRPEIKGIPGFWSNIHKGDRSLQVHVMGSDGSSLASRSEKHDPTRSHLAFAVADIDAARAELKVQSIEFWEYESLVGGGSLQLFFEDPFGNMIELQQAKA